MAELNKDTKAYKNKKAYISNYNKTHLKRVTLTMQPSEYDIVKDCADSVGLPVNTFIKQAVAAAVLNDHGIELEKWL